MKTGLNTALDPTRRGTEAEDFERNLRRRIVGQDDAILKMTEIYQMFLAGLNPPNRPVGNLLFLGLTGTGKTRVVESVAVTLFGEMSDVITGGLGYGQKPNQIDHRLDDKITRTATEAARRKFSPEFMNRIDKVVVFKTLKAEHLEQILEIELGMVQQRILQATGNAQFVFSCTPKVKKFLLQEGTDNKYGARHLKRAIEKNVVFPLANLVATGQLKL